jgi:hypothetical protein
MPRYLAMAVVMAFMAAGCGGPGTPVPVAGTASDLAALAGEWSGEYSSDESGRSGSIVFRLVAGSDSATGDVVMSPQFWRRGAAPGDPPAGVAPPPAPQVLSIKFVRVAGGRVNGRLDPYTDPHCGCTLLTEFEGGLRDDTLEGTYSSRHSATGEVQRGRWKVTRRRS